jgi:hypothetical protein
MYPQSSHASPKSPKTSTLSPKANQLTDLVKNKAGTPIITGTIHHPSTRATSPRCRGITNQPNQPTKPDMKKKCTAATPKATQRPTCTKPKRLRRGRLAIGQACAAATSVDLLLIVLTKKACSCTFLPVAVLGVRVRVRVRVRVSTDSPLRMLNVKVVGYLSMGLIRVFIVLLFHSGEPLKSFNHYFITPCQNKIWS